MEVTITIRASRLACPACTERMMQLETLSTTVAGCLACGGIWVAHVFGRMVLEAKLADATKGFFRHVAEHATGPRPAGYRTAGRREERTCPDCREALVPQKFGRRGIMLDLCGQHGTFFDLREIDAVVHDAEMQHAVALVEAERRAALRDDTILGMFDPSTDLW